MPSFRGSLPLPEQIRGWRRIGRFFVQSALNTVAVAATTTQTVASTGLILKCKQGQAIFIRRYVCGFATAAKPNFVIYFHASLELQAGAQPFNVFSGIVSNDTEMLTATPSAAQANAQTLSDMSITVMLRDDWHEFNDYIEAAPPGVGGAGLGLQSFARLRNTDAAATNVTALDNCLFEIWQAKGLQGEESP